MAATNLQFVAWSRRGVGAGPTAGQVGSRRQVRTSVVVSASRKGQAEPSRLTVDSAPMAVLGPGDVVGIAVDQVVRRTPRPDSHQLEPNYLASIEFAHPDIPWLFSPASTTDDRLQPWLMLAVVDRSEVRLSGRPGSPNPVLVLPGAGAVPPPTEAWAWAHVQVHGTDGPGATAALEGAHPVAGTIRSRVLCPTRLAPDHDYLAVLLPTYEAGRRVGIGEVEADAGAVAWVPSPGLVLPVYDSWRFRTGPSGDFETLARKLHGVSGPALESLGERRVTVEPRAALVQREDDGAADLWAPTVHRVGTAIAKDDQPGRLAPDSGDPHPTSDAFHRRLKELVDIVAAATDDAPVVGPPLYGRWPAEATSLDGHPEQADLGPVPDGTRQTWVEQLNADPFLRIAAGLGTQVVQRDQESLMTDAWTQLADVLRANARIRWARLHAETAAVVHTRLGDAVAASALRLTAPAFGRVRAPDGLTVRATVDTTTLPREVLGSTFLKVARYGVRADARSATAGAATVGSVTATLSGAVEAVRTSAPEVLPTRFTTPRAIDPGVLGAVLETGDLGERVRVGLGTSAADYLQRIQEAPGEITRIASRFTDTVPEAPVPGHGLPGHGLPGHGLPGHGLPGHGLPGHGLPGHTQPRITLTEEQAGQLGHAIHLVGGVTGALAVHPAEAAPVEAGAVEAGAVEVAPEVRAEIAALPATGLPTLSLQALAAVNELIDRGVAPGTTLDLSQSGVQIAVSSRLGPSVAVLTRAAGLSSGQTRVFDAGQQLRTAALTNFGVDAPGLEDVIGVVDADHADLLRQAFRDVTERATPLDAKPAPPTLATFDLGTRATVVDALEPRAAYGAMLAYAHQDLSEAVVRRPGSPLHPDSQFHPAMASPRFERPLVERLTALDPEWVLGGVHDLPANSICVLAVNWRFVESFLAGANHEMARELLWRGYPTDLRGTCFDRFWSPAPDITTMDHWTGPIPQHSATPGDRHELTVVVIKGDLLRRYPSTLVSAERGTASASKDDPQFTSDGEIVPELFRGFLGQDVTYVALDVPLLKLRTDVDPANRRHCWYVSLLEPHDEPRFGLDEPVDPPQDPNPAPAGNFAITDDWTWQGVQPAVVPGQHLPPDSVFAQGSSAVVGASLFQRPFRLLLRAPDYLPPE